MPLSKVVVVGAGPSGLLLTLLLARNNIPVLLVEQTNTLDTNSRATHHGEPATYEFERAGVLDAIRGESFFPVSLSWRKLDEQKSRPVKLNNPRLCLPHHRLGALLEKAVKKTETRRDQVQPQSDLPG
jgi:2-polyprenyl-6-methoxyphenol hydroxylase-like FAD-dependent oxidoreductase